MNIGGDGDLEQMQKCLGEILDEESGQKPINETMTDLDSNSDVPLTDSAQLSSNDLGNCVRVNFFFLLDTYTLICKKYSKYLNEICIRCDYNCSRVDRIFFILIVILVIYK